MPVVVTASPSILKSTPLGTVGVFTVPLIVAHAALHASPPTVTHAPALFLYHSLFTVVTATNA